MPRLTSLRTAALEDLARQLRYAPRERLLERLRNIEALAGQVEQDVNYPEDWLLFRITGHRPDIAEPATFVGGALRADLSALLERLSDEAELRPEQVDPEGLTLADLERRWSVTRKTLERRRRQGLAAWRVIDSRGRRRLLFTRATVERWEGAHESEVEGGRRFSRLSDEEGAALYERAVAMRAQRSLPTTRLAERLASESGRSVETVRRALVRLDREADEAALGARPRVGAWERRLAHRAWSRGASLGAIAARLGRSRGGAHRIVCERRAALLRVLALEVEPLREGEAAWGHPALRPEIVRTDLQGEEERGVASFVALADATPIPNRYLEEAWGGAHRHLLRMSARWIADLPRHGPSAEALDEIETALRWAALLREQMARSQRRIALHTIQGRFGDLGALEPSSAARVVDRAFDGVIRGVSGFDPRRGGRLAASVGLWVDRAIVGTRVETPPAGRARPTHARALRSWTARVAPWRAWLAPPARWRAHMEAMEEPLAIVAAARWGFGGGAPMTAQCVREMLECSPAALSRRERAAIRALRRAASEAGARA